jgi:hypothetical protein
MRRRMLLYSDATGYGKLAWVADIGGERIYARSSVPRWLQRWVRPRKVQVATWELVAALCALWQLFSKLQSSGPQWEIQLFIDSSVALGTLLRGSSGQHDWNALVMEIWFQISTLGVILGAWRVPSKQNLADSPTRIGKKDALLQNLINDGFREVEWQWPTAWLK